MSVSVDGRRPLPAGHVHAIVGVGDRAEELMGLGAVLYGERLLQEIDRLVDRTPLDGELRSRHERSHVAAHHSELTPSRSCAEP
ncbi:MAG TPA: hypothetical protein VK917_06030 [Ilumatobacter sp.]|nr:hypothetical protein [Ilumatobacter sp.]